MLEIAGKFVHKDGGFVVVVVVVVALLSFIGVSDLV